MGNAELLASDALGEIEPVYDQVIDYDPGKWFKIYDQYINRPVILSQHVGENEYMCERAGYIPAKQQIQNLIAAGERLEEYRKKLYSNGDEIDDESAEPDPTIAKSYDEHQATDDARAVMRSLRSQQKAATRKAKVKAEENNSQKRSVDSAGKKEDRSPSGERPNQAGVGEDGSTSS